MAGWFRRRPRPTARQRLLAEARRCGQYMTMILIDARRLGLDTLPAAVAVSLWRTWIDDLQDAAEDEL
jgi:hypothetical protein